MGTRLPMLRWLVATVVLTACCRAQTQAGPPEEGIYRVNVRLVMVDTQVLDKKAHQAIPSLKQNDFEVYEDGVRQKITAFSQDQLPLSVLLLFDLTDSVRPVLKSLSRGALESLNHLKPQDEVAVMAYAAKADLIQDFTTDRSLAAAAIERASRMESNEAAFFNEAIFQAGAQLERSDPSRRRVIIWLTDDVPNFPSDEIKARYGRSLGKNRLHTEKEAIEELYRTGTVVCTLLERSRISDDEFSYRLSTAGNTMLNNMLYPPGEVHKNALVSGGDVVEANTKHMQQQLAALIDEIRMRYSIGYHPSTQKPKGKFCTIKVKLSGEARARLGDVTIEARQGYYR